MMWAPVCKTMLSPTELEPPLYTMQRMYVDYLVTYYHRTDDNNQYTGSNV